MPDLSGLTLVEAKLVLQENQLSLGIVMSDSSENQLVNKQLPEAGDKITQGSIVDIWLNAPEN
jgi:beta-lactam-binding protein with PASTA domain